MKDYSEMHDAEINMLVCKRLGLGLSSYCRILSIGDHSILLEDNKTLVDYCNNPADAWPIIISNGISLGPAYFNDEWLAAKFKPTRDNSKPHEIETYSSGRPLRAAMIVYLQMMEQKK